ncbi:MAG: hypothetical protein Q8L05_06450 [Actinomycetota bacterium]|nr:hypothetical protein [Actinomycetota bacterium]MDP2287193.1 hypothetical protein [Actinomycetota bacterium]
METLAAFHIAFIVLPFLMALLLRRHTQPYVTRLFDSFLFIGVGVQGILDGLQQMTGGEEVAQYVGWAYSPFVGELGTMNFAFGVLGLIAPWASRGWKIATALGYGMFLAWAAVGHISDAISGDDSIGNIGPTLWSDVVIAAALLVLGLLTRDRERPHHAR